jgi:hypothetical protein
MPGAEREVAVKTYLGDFDRFRNMLNNREPFALSRFGDGELNILMGKVTRYGEFQYDPNDPTDTYPRQRLLASFRHSGRRYYVGISCPNCVGEERFAWAKQHSMQNDDHLTWATLFVNSNYARYMAEIVPLFTKYDVVVVCHRSAVLQHLPFPVVRDYRVGNNAWKNDSDAAASLCDYIQRERLRAKLFLLCAGPFSCILAHQLYCQSEANTYLDVGSTLDPFLFCPSRGTRRYLRGDKALLQRACIWK